MKNRSICAALVFALALALLPQLAFAWGYVGHTIINRLAAESLPENLPAFARTPDAIAEITTLGPEEDRIKGAGRSWDDDNDSGHYLDIGDDGTVAGVVRLDALPKDMQAYADALAKVGTNPYRMGYVPYSIMDGFERVRQDFAIWRVDDYLATHATTQEARDEFAKDRALREKLTLRDIGDWGHFVGDGSQPLHITVHFNGWGNYPNPNSYTTEHIHSPFETAFREQVRGDRRRPRGDADGETRNPRSSAFARRDRHARRRLFAGNVKASRAALQVVGSGRFRQRIAKGDRLYRRAARARCVGVSPIDLSCVGE